MASVKGLKAICIRYCYLGNSEGSYSRGRRGMGLSWEVSLGRWDQLGRVLGLGHSQAGFCLPCAQLLQSCPILRDHKDLCPPGSSVHGISQARILEWAAMSSSRGSSQLRDQTHVCYIVGRFFTTEPPGKPDPVLGSSVPRGKVLHLLAHAKYPVFCARGPMRSSSLLLGPWCLILWVALALPFNLFPI